jgi:hypothetical protein
VFAFNTILRNETHGDPHSEMSMIPIPKMYTYAGQRMTVSALNHTLIKTKVKVYVDDDYINSFMETIPQCFDEKKCAEWKMSKLVKKLESKLETENNKYRLHFHLSNVKVGRMGD